MGIEEVKLVFGLQQWSDESKENQNVRVFEENLMKPVHLSKKNIYTCCTDGIVIDSIEFFCFS